MTENVVELFPDCTPDAALEAAIGKVAGGVVIVGYDAEGKLEFRASTDMSDADVLTALRLAQTWLETQMLEQVQE